jgi:hypothetical protein
VWDIGALELVIFELHPQSDSCLLVNCVEDRDLKPIHSYGLHLFIETYWKYCGNLCDE